MVFSSFTFLFYFFPAFFLLYFLSPNSYKNLVIFIGSLVLDNFDIKYTMIIVGTIFTTVVYLLYIYMKPRVGLKPDKYKLEDINLKI